MICGSKVKFDILIGCRQGGLESPTLFNYQIPSECTTRQQRLERRMHGIEILIWLLYTNDLVLFCSDISEAQEIIITRQRHDWFPGKE